MMIVFIEKHYPYYTLYRRESTRRVQSNQKKISRQIDLLADVGELLY